MRPNAAVNINGLDWNVFFVDKTHEELVGEDGEQNAYGIALLREGEIYIDDSLPKGLMRKIVTHELIHAVAFTYSVDLDNADEEQICDFVATHFEELKSCRKAILKSI